MLDYLFTGSFLGLVAGISPGPLLVLVISETLRHGMNQGIKVALAPMVTDVPIVLLALMILQKLSHFQIILGCISIIGALFILYLGWENVRTGDVKINPQAENPKSFQKGIMINALSPHPYLFWITVGAPLTVKANQISSWNAWSFIISFYILLVGSKILLAILVGKSSGFLSGRSYLYTLRILGGLLVLFSFLLFWDGLRNLNIL